jgi:hypothetical protein
VSLRDLLTISHIYLRCLWCDRTYDQIDAVVLRDHERKRNARRYRDDPDDDYGERKEAPRQYPFFVHLHEAVQLSLNNEGHAKYESALELADFVSRFASTRFPRHLAQLILGYGTDTGVSGAFVDRSKCAIQHIGALQRQLETIEKREAEVKAKEKADRDAEAEADARRSREQQAPQAALAEAEADVDAPMEEEGLHP